jgi:methionine synthase I (cobalamin-dependent)
MISLEQALNQQVLLLNASPGNPAWSAPPDSAWGGALFHGSPNLNVTRPDLVLAWSVELLRAGANVLETRTHGAHPFTAAEYGADRSLCQQWNNAAVAIARQATGGRKFVIGAVGASTDMLTVTHCHTFNEHVGAFAEQIRDLWTAGLDAIHLSFFGDSQNLKAALRSIAAVEDESGSRLPVIITFDLDPMGTILSGERPEALWDQLRDYKTVALGLATYGYGEDTLRRLRDVTDVPLGLLLDPFPWAIPLTQNRPIEWLSEGLEPLLDERLLSFCGLSCTVPSIEYVKAVAGLIRQSRDHNG